METVFMNKTISKRQIIGALQEFARLYPDPNTYDDWMNKKTYKYAVRFEDRLYPPKRILSMAAGIPTSDFNGGAETNRVFRELGFEVCSK